MTDFTPATIQIKRTKTITITEFVEVQADLDPAVARVAEGNAEKPWKNSGFFEELTEALLTSDDEDVRVKSMKFLTEENAPWFLEETEVETHDEFLDITFDN